MNFAENKTGSSIITIIIIIYRQLNTNQSSQNTQKLILPGQEKILCPHIDGDTDNEVHGCPSLAYEQLSSLDGASVQNITQEMTVLHPTLFTLVDLES